MANTTVQNNTAVPFIDMDKKQFINVLLTGLIVGVVTWVLRVVLEKYVFGPIMCNEEVAGSCRQAVSYTNVSATILGAAAGLVILVRLRVYRPLLVALAACIALFGLYTVTDTMMWALGLVLFAVLHGITYGLFTWLTRIRLFVICLIAIIVAVVLIRLALN